MPPVRTVRVCAVRTGGENMIRSRRLVHAAVGGVVALSCTVLAAPAQAAPEADEPAGTVRLVTRSA